MSKAARLTRLGGVQLSLAVAALFAVLLYYSQTAAFAWDEGYPILASQLVARGKRLYLDFSFPQAPLNAWWNAAWMRVLGDSWHAVHAVAALLSAGSILLAADFVRTRFPIPAWRMPCAIAAALLIGLNAAFIEYTTTAQPYALCLFLSLAAFRVSVLAVKRAGLLATSTAGLLASAAASASLLVATVPAVLLLWTWRHSPREQRRRRLGAFLAGAAIPILPVLWLLAQAPRQVFFNVLEYQTRYRRANWEDATLHDWRLLTSSLTSPQPVMLALLAIAGAYFAARLCAPDWSGRSEFQLSGWLALAIGAELCAAHPTFEWYFVLAIPFLGIPAAAGLHAVAQKLGRIRPALAVAALLVLTCLGCAKTLYTDRNAFAWRDLEAVARKVDEVTPSRAAVWADEHVYFLTRRPPAEGTECAYTEVIDLPANLATSLHIVPLDELDRRAATGAFATVSTCEESEQIEALRLPSLFRHSAEVGTCQVFWGPVAAMP